MRVADSEPLMTIAGGRIRCRQCNAKSKRTGEQCKAPAIRGKMKCRFHGGLSTGPQTEEGRNRCADAKIVHGRETRLAREKRKLKLAELRGIGSLLKVFSINRE